MAPVPLPRPPGAGPGPAAPARAAALVLASLAASLALGASPAGAAVAHPVRHPPPGTFFARSGVGDSETAGFAAPRGWTLLYAYDCDRAPGGTGQFIVSVGRAPGAGSLSVLEQRPVRSSGVHGRGAEHIAEGGAGFYLQVNSQCGWWVAATR